MYPTKSVRRRLAAGIASLTALGAVSACSSTSAGGSQEPIAKEDILLVASVINTTNPYFASNIEGAKALGRELDLPVEIVDSEGSSQKEISKIQAILAQGKKVVLFVNTVASSDVPPIINACKQAGAYCTIWWNKPDDYEPWDQGDNFVAFQKHGGVDSGRCTASTLAERIGKGGIVALGGVQDSTTSQTRVAGLKDELKNYPDVELLEVRPANWDPQLAFQETQNDDRQVRRQDQGHLGRGRRDDHRRQGGGRQVRPRRQGQVLLRRSLPAGDRHHAEARQPDRR